MQLVTAALQGDARAWDDLYATYRVRIQRTVSKIVGYEDTEDCVQEVFIRVFQRLDTFKGESKLSTWLTRIAINIALMHLRKRSVGSRGGGVEIVSLQDVMHQGDDGDEFLLGSSIAVHDKHLELTPERLVLEEALAQLPKGYRNYIQMHVLDGMEHRQIAKLTKKHVGNSKSQTSKGLARLRKSLAKHRSSLSV